MSKKKIELPEDLISKEGVEDNNGLQALTETKEQIIQQLVDTTRAAIRLTDCVKQLEAETPALILEFKKTVEQVKNDVNNDLPNNVCCKVESAGNDVCDRIIEKFRIESKDLIEMTERHRKSILVNQKIFWCLISVVATLTGAFMLLCAYNWRLQITRLWWQIALITFYNFCTIGLTIYFCHKDK